MFNRSTFVKSGGKNEQTSEMLLVKFPTTEW